jgi:hypothetical protein
LDSGLSATGTACLPQARLSPEWHEYDGVNIFMVNHFSLEPLNREQLLAVKPICVNPPKADKSVAE